MRKLLASTLLLAFLSGVIGSATTDFATAQDKKAKNKPGDTTSEKSKETKPVTVIEVYKDSAGEFRFRIKNDDAVLAMASKGYKTKADCQKVIDIIKRDAAKAKVEDEK
jgi:uncharacterized protein YegP (UPF0339 family)